MSKAEADAMRRELAEQRRTAKKLASAAEVAERKRLEEEGQYQTLASQAEDRATVAEARARIGVIMGKSDIHLQKRTFVKEVTPTPERMPELLRDALHNRTAIPEVTVDVAYDELSGCFQVGRIGSRSLIARYYGLNPVSYPCQSFHTYHHLVSQAYLKVLKGDEPHYDHVLAAFQMPDSSVLWFPYQRVILPTRLPHGGKGVSVIAEAAKVDITLV